MTTSVLSDSEQRLQALDTSQSIIVQAPAGSGKTTLLVQRYLTLLAQVQKPEEILAITFTRKAASEMRDRIIESLQDADNKIGRLAQEHAARQGWNLIDHTERLKIQTIDSFCMSLVQSLPVTSGYHSTRDITAIRDSHYHVAIDQLFHRLYQDHPLSADLADVLALMGNDYPRLRKVFASMLKRRDQWLPPIGQFVANNQKDTHTARVSLETTLENLKESAIEFFFQDLDVVTQEELLAVGSYAAEQLGCEFSWELFANNFTRADGEIRQRLDKRCGFPPEGRDWKARGKAVLECLLSANKATALELLRGLPQVPMTAALYQEAVIMATGLALAAAQLQQVFSDDSVADFSELGICALAALQDENGPTDLALALNYRIHHILLDEFQDTSMSQFRLLEELVSGWSPYDGNTLFLVGDPMQSIYRFREAKVSLFLQAREAGINDVSLKSLVLNTNFRSQAGLVNWFNHAFEQALGSTDIPALGKISYSPSTAFLKETTTLPTLNCYLTYFDEVQALVMSLQKLTKAHPEDSVAILVRNRTVLPPILSALRQANIPWSAIDIGKLEDENIIRDLVTLMRCVAFETDPLSWTALLRCPFVGLTLADIQTLGTVENYVKILHSQDWPECLSKDGEARLKRLSQSWGKNLPRRFEVTPRGFLEQLFEDLGGYQAYPTTLDYEHAEDFFQLLEELGKKGWDHTAVASSLADLYASGQKNGVEILTIHKAKGLEFDHVFLPALDRGTRGNTATIAWRLEQSGLALATTGHQKLNQYLKTEERIQDANERNRLFYVAATRAKKTLHLSCVLEEGKTPKRGSLIADAWPALVPEYISVTLEAKISAEPQDMVYHVLPVELNIKVDAHCIHSASVTPQMETQPMDVVANNEATIGTLVHRILQSLSLQALPEDPDKFIANQLGHWRNWLEGRVSDQLLNASLELVQKNIKQTLNDPTGKQILSATTMAQSEFEMTGMVDGKLQNLVIDRTFIANDNSRWLVDYKTSAPKPGQSREDFLRLQHQTYQQQLDNYVTLLSAWDAQHTVKPFLYFTALSCLLPMN